MYSKAMLLSMMQIRLRLRTRMIVCIFCYSFIRETSAFYSFSVFNDFTCRCVSIDIIRGDNHGRFVSCMRSGLCRPHSNCRSIGDIWIFFNWKPLKNIWNTYRLAFYRIKCVDVYIYILIYEKGDNHVCFIQKHMCFAFHKK